MSEPRRWWLLFWSNEDSRNVVASREIIQPVAPNQILLEVIEAEPILARLKEAEEIVRWLADGGPCWSVHSRTMEPTFSHSEQATARAYLKKWEKT